MLGYEPTFDILVHKISDVLDDIGDEKIILLEAFVKRYKVKVLDSFDSVKLLYNRDSINELIRLSGGLVPPSFVAANPKILENADCFPLILKPLQTVFHPKSHQLQIVCYREELMSSCAFPIFAQKFIKHTAELFKVYVLGNNIDVVCRQSIALPQSLMEFDSQKISKVPLESSQLEYVKSVIAPVVGKIISLSVCIPFYCLETYDVWTRLHHRARKPECLHC